MLTLGNDESSDITNARAGEWDEIERKLNDNSFFHFAHLEIPGEKATG